MIETRKFTLPKVCVMSFLIQLTGFFLVALTAPLTYSTT